ncbi:E3 ubiquitin-protein ligase SIN-like [Trema orientale]|uniref:E3 ubiquitin-protein ligase SIN-like n=1 Tax=Trema orientale TaxID=63057 RepID=A0A2P5EZF0_TREOI|nr:E3 ubiquitin-protein ligase SIN-like [Trema orientale]
MASPFSSQNTNKNTETSSSSSSSLPPLPPSDTFLSADHFSNQCNQNYDSGFRTAPSSPPQEPAAPPPDTSSFPFPADASPQSGSVTGISSPPSPETTKSSGPLPAVLHGRDALPSHHLLKINPFSTLSKAPMEKFSSEFEAGGYKWNFSIYPTGDKTKDGHDHISVYLEIVETSTLPAGWEVNAMFNFFVFDQIRDKYVGPQDATVRRFHCMKTQWGVVKFIDLETFNNPYNGYLVNDTCSFGVEVFVVKTTSKAECLSLINKPATYKAAWSFPNISKVTLRCETEFFVGGDYKWRVLFYPKGYQPEGNKINNIISLYLNVDTSTLPAGTKLLVHYTFRMEDKKNGNHFKRSDSKLFSSAARGFREFMSLTKFKDPENGFLVGDACLIEAEVQVLGLVTLE